MRTLLLAGLALVLLVGCGDDDGGGGSTGGEQVAKLSGPVTYERGGGIAGRRDRLVVQPDGSAKLTVQNATKSIRLTAAELATLGRELDQADLASVSRNSVSKEPVPDALTCASMTLRSSSDRSPSSMKASTKKRRPC